MVLKGDASVFLLLAAVIAIASVSGEANWRQMQGRNGKRASQNGQNLRTAIRRGQPIRGRRRGGLAKGPLLLPAVQGEKDLKAAASWNERKKQNDGNKQEKESVALQQVEANGLEAIYQTANSNEVLTKEPINEDNVDVECKEETCEAALPPSSDCFLELSDHLPKNLAKVLEQPNKYVIGPKSTNKGDKKEIVIVGAGMAGLTAAYLLLAVGHKVTMVEASGRPGGRVYTRYEDDYYGDIGAMRFPAYHSVLMTMLKLFSVETALFSNYNEGSKGNFYYVNNSYIAHEAMANDPAVWETLYNLHGVRDIPRDDAGLAKNPVDIIQTILDESFLTESLCNKDTSLHVFLREKCIERNLDPRIVLIWAQANVMDGWLSYSLTEFLSDSDQKYWKSSVHHDFVEIVNGSTALTQAILGRLKEYPDFQLYLDSQVTKIDNSNPDQALVYYGKGRSVPGDLVFVATTAKAVKLIDFTDPLPYTKRLALDQLHYNSATKIFMKFKTAFWAKENKIPTILYGKVEEGQRAGGTGITDGILSQIYYPSHEYHGPSLIVSYTWGFESDLFLSFNESATLELAKSELEKIHGPVVSKEYESGFVYNWMQDPHSHGAFVSFKAFQKQDFMDDLSSPVDNIHFVGEYTNKFYNGWIESALESSVRSIVNIAPNQYNKEFMKGEIEFLTRQGRKLKR